MLCTIVLFYIINLVDDLMRHAPPSCGMHAMQAARLEVLVADGLMGPSPAVFEAGVPWWRDDGHSNMIGS